MWSVEEARARWKEAESWSWKEAPGLEQGSTMKMKNKDIKWIININQQIFCE